MEIEAFIITGVLLALAVIYAAVVMPWQKRKKAEALRQEREARMQQAQGEGSRVGER